MSSHRRTRSILTLALLPGVMLSNAGCQQPEGSRIAPSARPLPVDTARAGAEGATNWPHHRSIDADLNGDGGPEHLVLASDVQLSTSGVPLWEDGHRWAVFIATPPAVTLVYAAFVPNGHVEVAVLSPDAQGRRNVLIQERTPSRARSMVISYVEPGNARTVSEADYQIEAWLPALATP